MRHREPIKHPLHSPQYVFIEMKAPEITANLPILQIFGKRTSHVSFELDFNLHGLSWTPTPAVKLMITLLYFGTQIRPESAQVQLRPYGLI